MSKAFSKTLRLAPRPSSLLRPAQSPLQSSLVSSQIKTASTPTATSIRHSSHSPLSPTTPMRPRTTIHTLLSLYKAHTPITMITASDFPSAHVADAAGMDMILVGDSLAMVTLGMDDTSEIGLDEMIVACRAVGRGVQGAFVVGDLPMGSYEISPTQALTSSIRLIKAGRVHAVKLEGGAPMAPTIRAITDAGIPVLAHIGLTPQKQHALGGFRVQGKSTSSALALLRDALAVQEAGAFGVVLEAVPAPVAELVTRKLAIPTIGIGAGAGCSGQVIVQADMLGNYPPGRYLPKFVKRYGDVWSESLQAIEAYGKEVKEGLYPAKEHTYPMKREEMAEFRRVVEEEGGLRDKDVDPAVVEETKTLSVSLSASLRRSERIMVLKWAVVLSLKTRWRRRGAEPAGWRRIVTVGRWDPPFSTPKSPAPSSALCASIGSRSSTTEAAMVRGSSGSGSSFSSSIVGSGSRLGLGSKDGSGGGEAIEGGWDEVER
ncbi:hypothetical protein K402DRAFT_335712 [Aulographum hederae CBS 113979]|uniref:3-methyl-2-oxobutanoate hydroxymethyltransferase n=1 Tax=Aulographum hederae CBS 113979 TaxID=1176131 RepID=A0A6G1GW27_9PEZI|nr:hypothetical protein K402DRAFT_335712 [Aulographum hederae CBS 113979]